MKMDCYPRFQKSKLVQECMRAEMEGRPLPIEMPGHPKEPRRKVRKEEEEEEVGVPALVHVHGITPVPITCLSGWFLAGSVENVGSQGPWAGKSSSNPPKELGWKAQQERKEGKRYLFCSS